MKPSKCPFKCVCGGRLHKACHLREAKSPGFVKEGGINLEKALGKMVRECALEKLKEALENSE